MKTFINRIKEIIKKFIKDHIVDNEPIDNY